MRRSTKRRTFSSQPLGGLKSFELALVQGNFLFVVTFIGAIFAFAGQYSNTFDSAEDIQSDSLSNVVMMIVTHGHDFHAGMFPDISRAFSMTLLFLELVLLLIVLTMIFNLVSAIFQWYRFTLFRDK